MFHAIKKIVRQQPMLYKIWFVSYRQNRGTTIDFFSKKTRLLIDGYPRSGNTYFVFLVKKLFPEVHFVHHFHAIAPIKIALSKNIPVVILLRDPVVLSHPIT